MVHNLNFEELPQLAIYQSERLMGVSKVELLWVMYRLCVCGGGGDKYSQMVISRSESAYTTFPGYTQQVTLLL